ncbi:MAG: hypothetical protein HKN13_03235 [Rhodothermales bacterium]|nr:hypothetical protein [Rhodothermales bacterium]
MRLLSLTVLFVLIAVVGCTDTFPTEPLEAGTEIQSQVAKKPFVATNSALFNPAIFTDHTKPSWYGTYTVDDVEYGQVFYSMGTGKPFDDPVTGQAFHAMESFEVYTWIDFDPELQTLTTGDLLMTGVNLGVQTQSVFRSHGRILEAHGPFEGLAGRPLSGRATVEWAAPGLPYSASGVMKIPW